MLKQDRELIKAYFRDREFIYANKESFNNFCDKFLQRIVDDIGDIVPTVIPQEVNSFVIRLKKIWVEKPFIIEADGSKRNIYPYEARLRKLTYSAPVFMEVSAVIDGVQRETFTTMVGRLPIMLKSKYCHLYGLKKEDLIKKGEDPDDIGGYFIINGNERVLISVEDLASNKFFIERKNVGPSEYTAKLFSEMGAYRIPHTIEQMKDGIFYLTFTRFRRIPVVPVIKALGLTKDQEIMKLICGDKEYDGVIMNLYNSAEIKSEDDALEYLGKKAGIVQQPKDTKFEKVEEQLDKYLLPHIGNTKKERLLKAYNLCKLLKKFLLVSEEGRELSDKDNYTNKRLKLSGDLLEDLFRVNLRTLVQDIIYNFQRLVKRGKFQSIKIIIRDELLSSNIKSSMATGTWTGGRKGVSQNIDKTNKIASISHLQRIVSLLTSTQENFEARALHLTHWGRLCLKKDTNILLADKYSNRNLETLQNCWNHHSVTTFDTTNNKLKPSTISKYFTSNPKLMGKKIYKLTSESGREITATEDHLFYTKNGWKDNSALKIGDEVAVYPSLDPIETPNLPTQELGIKIADEKEIMCNFKNRFKHYIKELRLKELLPLTTNNYKIEIIAKLLGHIFSDGHCGKNNLEFYCGNREDAGAITRDIRLLGFEPSKITEKHTKILRNKKIINYKTFTLSKGGSLHALLVLAGAPSGKKTDTNIKVPKWIFKSSLSVKREFLAALLGGDDPKLRVTIRKNRKSGSKINIDNLIFHKKSNLKNNAVKFLTDLKVLFNEFGVIIKKINTKEDYIRKDGSNMLKCELIFGKSNVNMNILLNKIGYRYCIEKEKEAIYIGEWLRLHNLAIKEKIKLKDKVQILYKEGISPKKISDMLNINHRVINGWLFENYKYKKTRVSQNMLLPYEKWVVKNKLGDSGSVWEKIIKKEIEDLNDVRDFTTTENTHSFIANGFITHNCPIETPEGTSIGLRKNLAMFCEASQENLNEEKIKKLLEGSGIKFIKND